MNDVPPDEHDIRTLMREAMHAHQRGQLAEADELYARVVDTDPGYAQAWRLRGILARERGELDVSIRFLQKASQAAPDEAEALSELGLSHMAMGDLSLAEIALREALARNPDAHKALINLGAVLQFRGHILEAVGLYRHALAIDSDDLEVRCNLAKALVDAGQGEEALAECEFAVSASGGHPVALATQGAVLCDLKHYDDAEPVLAEACARDPGDTTALVNLGFARRRLNRLDAAAEALRQAVNMHPGHARAVADLTTVLAATGQREAGLELSEDFLGLHPGECLVVAAHAFALRDAGRADEARSYLDYPNLIRVTDIGAPDGFESVDAFNKVLASIVETHPSLLTAPVSKATYGGSQTGDLDCVGNAPLSVLCGLIEAAADDAVGHYREQFGDHPVMARSTEVRVIRAWGTVLGDGGYQVPHMHPVSWLSGVYYVRVPADMARTDPHAGWIEFGAPPEDFVTASDPELHAVEPKEGRLLLFPSWFWHRTWPFEAHSARISIAFDLVPQSMLRLI